VVLPSLANKVDSEKAVVRRSQRAEGGMEPVVVKRFISHGEPSTWCTIAVVVILSAELVLKPVIVLAALREVCIAETRSERLVEGGKEIKFGSTSHERWIVPE
jgi:hypothetical protein